MSKTKKQAAAAEPRKLRVRIAERVRKAADKKLVASMPYQQKLAVCRIVRAVQRRSEEDAVSAGIGVNSDSLEGLQIIPGFDEGVFMRMPQDGSVFDIRRNGEVLPPQHTRVELFSGTDAARHVRTFSPGMLKMCSMFAAAVNGDDIALSGKDIYSGFRTGLIPEYARYFAYRGKDKATAARLSADLVRRRDELIAYTREKAVLEGETSGKSKGG